MKTKLFYFLMLLIFKSSCDKKPEIKEVFDKKGHLIEKYGNTFGKDSDEYFHNFYQYDTNNNLISEKLYDCQDLQGLIEDAHNYTERKYIYSKNKLVIEQTYYAVYGEKGKVLGHQLVDEKNHVTGKYKEFTYP
jgi:hypothetical protein